MIVISSAIALTMAAYLADPAERAQNDFNNCMVDIINEHLERKDSLKTFKKASETACAEDKAKFRNIIVKEEKGFGSSQSEAEEYADEEAQGVIGSFADGYGDYVLSNSRPQKIK